jgi:hypothetical protein
MKAGAENKGVPGETFAGVVRNINSALFCEGGLVPAADAVILEMKDSFWSERLRRQRAETSVCLPMDG